VPSRGGPGDELVDVVDAEDRVVATVTRREMRARRLRHRAVFVVVNDRAGRLLVHRRSDAKDLWPGRWDAADGEPWDDAARRELAEEVDVDAEPEPLCAGAYADADVDLVARCYRARHDGPVRFVDGEVVEARWVDRDELTGLLATASFVPDSAALLPLDVLFPFGGPADTHAG
jgi:isopentenyldiphosphate isomerase